MSQSTTRTQVTGQTKTRKTTIEMTQLLRKIESRHSLIEGVLSVLWLGLCVFLWIKHPNFAFWFTIISAVAVVTLFGTVGIVIWTVRTRNKEDGTTRGSR